MTVDALYYIVTLVGCNLLRLPGSPRGADPRSPTIPGKLRQLRSSGASVLPTRVCHVWCAAWGFAARVAFAVSAVSMVLHDLGMWGLGRGTEFHILCGFFLLMDVGARGEFGFRKLMGRRVGGLWGWA
jgi:hypothetical protein